jgi:hypothetical protein
MKALYWLVAVAAIAACFLLFQARYTSRKAAGDFQAYGTRTVDLLKDLEDPKK